MRFRHIDMPPEAASTALQHRRRVLLDRIAGLGNCPDTEFAQQFPSVVDAVEAAFRHEDALLELLGDAGLHPCRAHHASILCALHRTATRVEDGDLERGREVAAALEAILRPPPHAPLPASGAPRQGAPAPH